MLKAVLWQVTGSWSAQNKLCSDAIGAKVQRALDKAKAEAEDEVPGLSLPGLDD